MKSHNTVLWQDLHLVNLVCNNELMVHRCCTKNVGRIGVLREVGNDLFFKFRVLVLFFQVLFKITAIGLVPFILPDQINTIGLSSTNIDRFKKKYL